MIFVKKDTAVVISFGPFLDKTDGITLKADGTTITDRDHATTGIFLSPNGGDAAIRHQSVTASVADDYGMMRVTLDTTDTNTLGVLRVAFAKAATYLPVWQDLMVVTANVWDTLFGADLLQADVTQLLGTAWLTPGTAGTPDVNVKTQSNIDFGALQKASIGTAVETQLTAANTELASIPTTTGGMRSMVQFLFEYFRNKKTVTASVETLFKEDASTSLGTASLADDGTTFTRGEMGS